MQKCKKVNFVIYGDSWFEILKFIDSVKKLCSSNSEFLPTFEDIEISIKEYHYFFSLINGNEKYELNFRALGKYKDNLDNKFINDMVLSGGKPDILIFSKGKPILGIEDTDTAQVGNSSLQRMDRVDWFIRNEIPFLYSTFFTTFDRSASKIQERRPSIVQKIFFDRFHNINILYKRHQDIINSDDDLLLAKYFFDKILHITEDLSIYENMKLEPKEEQKCEELNSFSNKQSEGDKWNWKPSFVNDSMLLSKLYDERKLFTFSHKCKQKVGFARFEDIKKAILEFDSDVDFNGYDNITDWVLINPVMFVQKTKNSKFVKVDPATGEFVFFRNLFDENSNLTLIYSPNATTEIILNSRNKLSHHLKNKSDLILLSNNKETRLIDKNLLLDYSEKITKRKVDEDDIDFVIYNYFLKNDYKSLYISAPCASWSRLTYNTKKIMDISKDDERPDYVYINEKLKIIVIGESKEKYNDLLNKRDKHLRTFLKFKNEMIKFNEFKGFEIVELNMCLYEENITPNHSLIMVKYDDKFKYIIDTTHCKNANKLFSNNEK